MTTTLKPDTIREAWPVLAALPFPVMYINTDFTVVAANPAAVERYGAGRGKCFRISHGYDSPCEEFGQLCPMRAAEVAAAPVSVLHVSQAGNGVDRCKVTASPILGGGVLEFHIPLEDVTTFDMLTGLVNRNEGEQLLRHSAALMRRCSLGYSLVALDLDHFKRINDTFGHPQGDRVLKAFARSLRDSVRETDILVRWGGEEFLVMLPGAGVQTAQQLAGCILSKVRELRFSIAGAELGITVSAGIRTVDAGEAQVVSFEEVVRDADAALYEAKRAGRDRYRLHRP